MKRRACSREAASAATARLKDEFNAKQAGMSKFYTVFWPSVHF